jgi:hypothetical protein
MLCVDCDLSYGVNLGAEARSAWHGRGVSGHDHDHGVPTDPYARRILGIVLCVSTTILAVEVVGALWSGSLALLADAGHMLTDVAGLSLGLVAAVLVLLVKSESALVHVARAEAGKPLVEDTREVAAPRARGLRRVREAVGLFPFFRAFVAMEFTLLALAAAIMDEAAGDLAASRVLVYALVAVGALTAAGHLAAILASNRLR